MSSATTDLLAGHGLPTLPSVTVDRYNLDIRRGRIILNHKLRKAAFYELLDTLRVPLQEKGEDPFPPGSSHDIKRKNLEKFLKSGDTQAATLIETAISSYAGEIALVLEHFLKTKEWTGVERIAVGGGFRKGQIGELCIHQAGKLLQSKGMPVDLQPIRHHPDEAGLIGAAHLLPTWALKGNTGMLAVDIGGTNLRVGVLSLNIDREADLSATEVWKSDIWQHADDDPKRENGLDLAPVIGVACPGVVAADGSILRGAVNLPGGNWESERFNLPKAVLKEIDSIGGHQAVVVMHNDAVVQGLSQRPWMTDVKRWGIITIGTGLGNACFTNKEE
jgi:hypothetical protein